MVATRTASVDPQVLDHVRDRSARAADTKPLVWADLTRATAALLVVALHTFGHWLYSLGSIPNSAWQIFNWIDSSTRASVPLFFMLSGALLLGREKQWNFLWRRASRIIPPLLFFSVVAFVFTSTLDRANYVSPWRWITTPAYFHLWFFYKIAALYPIFFIMNPSRIDPRAGFFVSLCGVLVFGGGIEQWKIAAFTGHEVTFAYLLYGFGGYFGSFCRFTRRDAIVCGVVFVACVVWIAIGTSERSFKAHTLDETLYGYVAIPVVIAAFAGFVSLKVLGESVFVKRSAAASRAVRLLSRHSIGIYGLHAFILQFSYLVIPAAWTQGRPVVFSVLIYAFVVATSLLTSVLIGRVDRGWILGRA